MKTFFQLREETTGRTIKVSKDIFETVLQLMNEETEYGHGYSSSSQRHAKKGIAAAHAAGLKINHEPAQENEREGIRASGNTPGSKPHKNPDITIHYEHGDEPHTSGSSGSTLHTAKAKSHASAAHFKKAHDIAEREED